MSDFNTYEYSKLKDTSDFVDINYASLLYLTINTLTQIKASLETLIGNIFYNDFTEKLWQEM